MRNETSAYVALTQRAEYLNGGCANVRKQPAKRATRSYAGLYSTLALVGAMVWAVALIQVIGG